MSTCVCVHACVLVYVHVQGAVVTAPMTMAVATSMAMAVVVTALMFVVVTALTSLSTLYKLEPLEKRKPQLRNCLHQIGLWPSVWCILLLPWVVSDS